MSALSHLTYPITAQPRADNNGRGEAPGTSTKLATTRIRGPQGRSTRTPGLRRLRCRRSSVWREQVRSRLADLQVDLDHVPCSESNAGRLAAAGRRLDEAAVIVDRRPSLLGLWTGVDIEGTWMRIHAVEVALTRLSRPETVRAKLVDVIYDGSRLLGEDHPRVKTLRAYAKRPQWNDDEREALAQSVRAVYAESDKENVRLRSFRNILLGATLGLTVLVVGFGVLGILFPSITMLFGDPASTATTFHGCSAVSRTEVVVIELLGLISATLVGAVAIRRMHGTSTVYGVPMASLLLKLPMGALTALAGILIIRAGLAGPLTVAGESQVFAYALLFGASQQGFTGLVDRQTHNVLNSVSSKDNA
jgi:hypothetical protein